MKPSELEPLPPKCHEVLNLWLKLLYCELEKITKYKLQN